MANRRLLSKKELLAEIAKIEEGDSDDESITGSISETEDAVLSDDDPEDDDYVPPADSYESDNSMEHNNTTSEYGSSEAGERNFVLGKDNTTIWTDTPLSSIYSRCRAKNIVTHLPGPKGRARGLTSVIDIFHLFVTDEMIETVVRHTNEEIEKWKLTYTGDSQQSYTSLTHKSELKSFIGLLYMVGVLKQSGLTVLDLFSPVFGPSLFRCAMGKNRFEFLLRVLRFDSKVTRAERRKTDKFAPFREFWNLFDRNCRENYTPSEYVTVDETLLSFRGRCPFKMYIPNKPDKYGLKIVSLCDARTYYFCGGIPYVGKEARQQSDLLLPTQYVLTLTECIKNTNRNVTTDNWFSSCQLAEELRNNKLTLVGTLRKNKKEIPKSFIDVKGLPPETSRFLYDDEKMIVSYVQKKKKIK